NVCDTGNWSAPTTITGNPSQTKTTGCYLYTLTGTDNVGNAVSISTIVKVDTSDPTIGLTLGNATGGAYYAGSGSVVYFKDDAAPTGGALAVNGQAATGATPVSYASGSFDIGTLTLYTEAQDATHSGLASSSLVRTQAAYTGPDTCGAFGSPTTINGPAPVNQ